MTNCRNTRFHDARLHPHAIMDTGNENLSHVLRDAAAELPAGLCIGPQRRHNAQGY
jgi:hypothetical protein